MKKWICLTPFMLLFGCAEVPQVATRVIEDPNVIAAATATGQAVVTAVGLGYPEVAVVVTAGIALAEAIKAMVKAKQEVK